VRPRFSPRCESMVPVTDDGTTEPAEPDAE